MTTEKPHLQRIPTREARAGLTAGASKGIGQDVKGAESGTVSSGRQPRRPDAERLRRDLTAYMASRGLRSTEQRRLIIETFFDTTEHITIEKLLEKVRSTDPHVGYATVYRTMKLLAESGIVDEHKFVDGFTRYELADEQAHHDHLICLKCGSITEFEEPLIEELQDRIAARYSFEVQQHKHELYGVCRDCRTPKRKPKSR
jgi:Fur family ferric uptake transcriptional regulator